MAVTGPAPGPGAAALDEAGNPIAPGGGVDVAAVERAHAAWLDRLSATLRAQVGQTTTNERYAGEVERLLAEPTEAGLQQVQAIQASESGVNLDEELAQMVSFQHVYAASAPLLSAYDEMLTTLIERTG